VLVRSSVVMRKLSGLRAFTRGQLDLRLYKVLRCAPLFWRCGICMVSWMGPKECVCSVRCLT